MKSIAHALNPRNWRMGVWAAICLLGVIMSSYAWIVASPTGASPDDDFHQISIWCPTPDDGSCNPQTGADGSMSVEVPQTVAFSACYAFYNTKSAACTEHLSDDVMIRTTRFNDGLYPGGYYDAMHMFVEHDVDRAVLVMRWVNVGLAALIYGSIFLLASLSGRRLIVYTLLGTAVPLVTYFSTSLNPSAWAILGVTSAWLALHLAISSPSRPRRIALLGIGVVGATLGAMARADAGAYLVIVACAIIAFHWTTIIHKLRLVLPTILVAAIGGIGFLNGRQSSSALSNGMYVNITPDSDPLRVLVYNVYHIPDFIAGFWSFDMGWLDTGVPWTTTILSAAVAIGLCCFGLSRGRISLWQALSLIGLAVALVAVPVAILQASLSFFPGSIQARYIAPLIIVFVGTCLADRKEMPAPLPLAATVCFFAFIVAANVYALHMQIERYVSGLGGPKAINLSLGIQWWRAGGPSPMYTWILGSLGFALMSTILFAVRMQTRDSTTPEEVSAPHARRGMSEIDEDRVPQP